jgi:TolB-like protein
VSAIYKFGPFRLDAAAEVLLRGTEPVTIGRRAVAVLCILIDSPGMLISKGTLIEAVWSGRTVEESNLAVQIAALRRVLAEGADEHRIDTLPRRGYRFVGPVTREDCHVAAAPNCKNSVAVTLPYKPAVAVLPFTNMSCGPDVDGFAEGVADEIVTALARCSGLSVIARTSSSSYRSDAMEVAGHDLGARYVLKGSVRRSGERLRFTCRLIDATNGLHIWAERYEGDTHDAFGLQDLFTEAVVAAIEPKIERAEIERLKHRPAVNFDAYELYLRSLQLTHEFTRESFAAASRLLEHAHLIDPADGTIMALAAYCHAERSTQGWAQDLETESARGLDLAGRAIESAKDDANVFWMTAYAILRLRQDAHNARALAQHSIRLNPNSAMALAVAGRIEHSFGNNGTALELLGRAQRLSAFNPRGWFVATGLANAHMSVGDFGGALAAAMVALRQNPRSAVAHRVAAASLAKLGRQEQAADAVRNLLVIDPDLTVTRLDAQRTYVMGGWWSEFLAALRLAGLPR